jgi:hypothetical protein
MNDRKKLEKKKEREKKVRHKIQLQREAILKQSREDKAVRQAEIAARPKMKPIRKGLDMNVPDLTAKIDPEEAKRRLEHNLKILQALEEEYDKEQAERLARNEEMEAEGLKDFNSKLEVARDIVNKSQYAFGGQAGCRVLSPVESSEETINESIVSESSEEKVSE